MSFPSLDRIILQKERACRGEQHSGVGQQARDRTRTAQVVSGCIGNAVMVRLDKLEDLRVGGEFLEESGEKFGAGEAVGETNVSFNVSAEVGERREEVEGESVAFIFSSVRSAKILSLSWDELHTMRLVWGRMGASGLPSLGSLAAQDGFTVIPATDGEEGGREEENAIHPSGRPRGQRENREEEAPERGRGGD
ncbi:hypothetical protein B0H13DRAFT_1887074 [Mycena leptocephala]|nr:hypothetical protein B0H13DRAFT_1887074 [Mycena leptocephala]